MILAVTDANIFIDLIEVNLVEEFFRLDLRLHTTDVVINELDYEQKLLLDNFIENGKLFVKKLNEEELEQLSTEIVNSKKLSKPDISVYIYAKSINALILTSDRKLRVEAEEKGFEVHGILWVFECLITESILTTDFAASKLRELILINTWLPKTECIKRIEKWTKNN